MNLDLTYTLTVSTTILISFLFRNINILFLSFLIKNSLYSNLLILNRYYLKIEIPLAYFISPISINLKNLCWLDPLSYIELTRRLLFAIFKSNFSKSVEYCNIGIWFIYIYTFNNSELLNFILFFILYSLRNKSRKKVYLLYRYIITWTPMEAYVDSLYIYMKDISSLLILRSVLVNQIGIYDKVNLNFVNWIDLLICLVLVQF